ncbi:hypothetical protein [Acetobacter orleanensis]|nr:hypothetical protein [Acetobacter orleanensis]
MAEKVINPEFSDAGVASGHISELGGDIMTNAVKNNSRGLNAKPILED